MKKIIDLFVENFSFIGLIIVGVSLLPSVILAFLPPVDSVETKSNLMLTIFETLGRIAVILILLFSKKCFTKKLDVWFILMCIFGLLYYVGWIRYIFFGHTFALLYKPLWLVPVPLTIFPILAFAFAAIWSKNIPLGVAVIILAIGHIPQGFLYYNQIK